MHKRIHQPMRPRDGSRHIGHYGKRNDPTRTRAARAATIALKRARQLKVA